MSNEWEKLALFDSSSKGKVNLASVNNSYNASEIETALSYLDNFERQHPEIEILSGAYSQEVFDLICKSSDPVNFARGICHLVNRYGFDSLGPESTQPPPKLGFFTRALIYLGLISAPKVKLAEDLELRARCIGKAEDYGVASGTTLIENIDRKRTETLIKQDKDAYYTIIATHENPVSVVDGMVFLSSNELLRLNYLEELEAINSAKDPHSAAKVLVSLNRRGLLDNNDPSRNKTWYQFAKTADSKLAVLVEETLIQLKIGGALKDVSTNDLINIFNIAYKNFKNDKVTVIDNGITKIDPAILVDLRRLVNNYINPARQQTIESIKSRPGSPTSVVHFFQNEEPPSDGKNPSNDENNEQGYRLK